MRYNTNQVINIMRESRAEKLKADFLLACLASPAPCKSAVVYHNGREYGPHSLPVAYDVAADLGGGDIVDTETGEVLNA